MLNTTKQCTCCKKIKNITMFKKRKTLSTGSSNELYNWMIIQPNFSIVFNNWVSCGYDKNLIPSIDRKDNRKPYSFNNIELTTWEINNKRGNIDYKRIHNIA